MSNLMKIRLVGAELFHVDDQEDRHIDITKPTLYFRSLVNASKVSRVRKCIHKKTHILAVYIAVWSLLMSNNDTETEFGRSLKAKRFT
jgi:hypothetical protein